LLLNIDTIFILNDIVLKNSNKNQPVK